MTRKRYVNLMRVWVHMWWLKYGDHVEGNMTEGGMLKALTKGTPRWDIAGVNSYTDMWEKWRPMREDVGMH